MNTGIEKIKKLKQLRQFLLSRIADLNAEQLNKIPEGFNNNIIWNLAHLIFAQQSICYLRAGQKIKVSDKYISPYKTNTKPAGFIDEQEIEIIKQLLLNTIDELLSDYHNRIFSNYNPPEGVNKTYGIAVNDIDEALDFLLYHDGLHSGYIMSLKRLLK